MVLIILTEIKPYKALENVLRKMAFFLIPLSVLFIKYIPQLGRAYHMGRPMFIGVTGHKNALGMLCMLLGIYFCWLFLYRPVEHSTPKDKIRIGLYSVMVIMIVWLTYKANSATSLFCTFIAISVLLVSRMPSFRKNPQRVLPIFISLFLLFFSLEYFFNIKDQIITLLGREPTLTSRVPMWSDLISMVRNPILGYGYDSFWLGERQQIIYSNWGISGNAHNGYLEMYLNLGLIGLFFIGAWFISGFRKIKRYLQIDYSVGILRFILVLVVAIHGYTEAAFYGVSSMWMLLFLAIIDPPLTKQPDIPAENPEENRRR
jgi:O-antigen ligase